MREHGKGMIERCIGENGSDVNFGPASQFLFYAPTYGARCGLTMLYGVMPKHGQSRAGLPALKGDGRLRPHMG